MDRTFLSRLFNLPIAPSFILYVLVLLICYSAGIEPEMVLRDLMQTCEQPIGVGLISNLGILLWGAAASISLFVSFSGLTPNSGWRNFLLLGGLFSTLLCLDDFFLLHDSYQISQDILYITYISLALFFLYKYTRYIYISGKIQFLTSVLFLGLSLLADIFQHFLPINYQDVQLFEEGFKFIGVSCWLAFWSQASFYAISDK